VKLRDAQPEETTHHAGQSHSSQDDLIPGAHATITRSTAHAIVIKDESLFFVTEPDGSVPLEKGHGFGLYYHDCRFLCGYELRLSGRKPEPLVWTAEHGFMATLGLSNPDMLLEDGSILYRHNIEVRWTRALESGKLALFDSITFNNLRSEPVAFKFSLAFQSEFEDIFAVRGLLQQKQGKHHPPAWEEDSLNFFYEGTDGVSRGLAIRTSLPPQQASGTRAYFHLELGPKESQTLLVSLAVSESRKATLESSERRLVEPREAIAALRRTDPSLGERTRITTDSLMVNKLLDRSLRDLRILRSHNRNVEYFAAGIPWFAALFGRDSIITALQTLAYNPHIAEHTLQLLAGYQGRKEDEWREEEPGKILHELRLGEMAANGEIPHSPYYGSVDSTPLFLVLVGEHARWTGDLALFDRLREPVEMALDWVSKYGDRDRDGYVEYVGRSEKGLANQGWKDSGDSIVNKDGTLAAPPIALVEVQGYVYRAKVLLSDLYSRAGEGQKAKSLLEEANSLKERFNRDYWLDDGFYAMALQRGRRPVDTLSSNAGHALWSGIADPDKAGRTAESLMGEDMFNGWGVRTLSERELRYNPLGYHLGTVWPHDNSLIAAGMRSYGFDEFAARIYAGMFEAALHFDINRLPELFGGFAKKDYGIPVIYPVTCQPQAWAAGAIPYLIKTLLGLEPDAFEGRLRVVRPVLPDPARRVEVRGLRVGRAVVDLKFERTDSKVSVEVIGLDGNLDVEVEP
jgi:glycogen debranching enzyme